MKVEELKEIEGFSKETNNLLIKILQVNPIPRLNLDEIFNYKLLDKDNLSQRIKI